MRNRLPLGTVALGAAMLGMALLVAGCNVQGITKLYASPAVVATAGGSSTLHWNGNGVSDYTLKVSPTTGVQINGTAYSAPVDLHTDTSATVTLPGNASTTSNATYTFTLIASDASGGTLASIDTKVTVAMSSAGLWAPDYGNDVIDFFPSGSLGSNPSPAASIRTGIKSARVVAFDASGNLWTANEFAGTITEYPAVGVTVDPSPTTTVRANVGVVGLAFDASGNLWVTNTLDNTVSEYGAASLATHPAVVRTITGLQGPLGLAFDSAGNLWIVNWGTKAANWSDSSVVEYTAASLSGTPVKGATITKDLNKPEGLAFDASGNLWVGNQAGGTVVRFPAGSLTANPAADVKLTTGSANNAGVLLDASGNLWVSHQGTTIHEFAAADIGATGSPAPAASISGMTATTLMPAFDPPPSNLPLHH